MRSPSPLAISLAALALCCLAPAARAQWVANGRALCTAANNQLFPVAVSDGAGGAIVAWYDQRSGTHYDIYAQRVLSSGLVDPAWPADGRALCTASGDQIRPAIVSDGAGGAIVAWEDGRGASFDIYAQRVLANGTVDPSWPANGRVLCAAGGDQITVAVASDAAGGAIVTWDDFRSATNSDIYAQRVLGSGAIGAGWPADGRLVCGAANAQSEPAIVADGAGGAIVAWHDFRGVSVDVYAQRILSTGIVDAAWPADGRALCTATGNQFNPKLATDNAGGAIVTWHDGRSGNNDIYAHHVLSNGAVDAGWPVNGRAVCVAVLDQAGPSILSAGAGGGALITWQDARTGNYDVYVHRVLASGAVDPAWPANGRAVCTAPNNQVNPRFVSDGSGGVIVAWQDARSGVNDIYAHRVMSSGAVDAAWPANGQALCTATGQQRVVTVVSDGSGGAIVAWDDGRGGASDVYAQRVYQTGIIADVSPRGPGRGGLGLLAPFPNPVSGGALTIRFALAAAGRVSARILDPAGHVVRALADREFAAGAHELSWDGMDRRGAPAPSGIYFLEARTGGAREMRRFAILR